MAESWIRPEVVFNPRGPCVTIIFFTLVLYINNNQEVNAELEYQYGIGGMIATVNYEQFG